MASFKIEGGHKLNGTITPQGAKNEALQILCAVLLTPEKVTIHNIPDIIDINKLIFIIGELGVKINKLDKNSYTFQADKIRLEYLESPEFKRDGSSLRGSIMIVGPLLARYGKGYIPRPGGDKIGRRRLDTHFEGFIRLGATFRYNKEEYFYGVEAPDGLLGSEMLLDEAAVILAGVRANQWRILVGDDAVMLDERVRANPWNVYDLDFSALTTIATD